MTDDLPSHRLWGQLPTPQLYIWRAQTYNVSFFTGFFSLVALANGPQPSCTKVGWQMVLLLAAS